jgi:hypothetical protein
MRTLLLATLLAACSGGSGSLGGDVTGTWRQLPNAFDVDPSPLEDRQTFEFHADGTIVEIENGNTNTGHFSTNGGQLSIVGDGETKPFVIQYAVVGDRFVFGAYAPVGDVNGFVGTWTSSITFEGDSAEVTIDIAADNTAIEHEDWTVMPDQDLAGTWTAMGNDIEITQMPQPNVTVEANATLVGGVIGTAYERVQ